MKSRYRMASTRFREDQREEACIEDGGGDEEEEEGALVNSGLVSVIEAA